MFLQFTFRVQYNSLDISLKSQPHGGARWKDRGSQVVVIDPLMNMNVWRKFYVTILRVSVDWSDDPSERQCHCQQRAKSQC